MSIVLPKIAVMCGSANDAVLYDSEMADLGRAIAQHPARLVWGGGNVGSMGVVSRSFKQHSNIKPLGFLPGFLMQKEKPAPDDSAELHYVDGFETRMDNFWQSDIVVVAPGGIGTIQELGDVIAKKYCRLCVPHILVLNLNGFFNSYFALVDRCRSDGFVNAGHDAAMPDMANNVAQAAAYFAQKLQCAK